MCIHKIHKTRKKCNQDMYNNSSSVVFNYIQYFLPHNRPLESHEKSLRTSEQYEDIKAILEKHSLEE